MLSSQKSSYTLSVVEKLQISKCQYSQCIDTDDPVINETLFKQWSVNKDKIVTLYIDKHIDAHTDTNFSKMLDNIDAVQIVSENMTELSHNLKMINTIDTKTVINRKDILMNKLLIGEIGKLLLCARTATTDANTLKLLGDIYLDRYGMEMKCIDDRKGMTKVKYRLSSVKGLDDVDLWFIIK